MRISQLAERAGIPATTLRFYETAGLLPADRTPAGHRLYGQDAVERLEFIGAAKHLGLPLEEIAELLHVWSSGSCAEVKADLRPRIAARLAEAEARIAELTGFTASLRQALAHLDALPDRSCRCDPGCGVVDPGLTGGVPGPVPVELSPRPDTGGQRWRQAPVACSLTGDGMAERARRWQQFLSGAERQEIDEGMRLTLPADRSAALAALAVDEQRCCPFFDFRLHLDGPVVHLEVRARADGAALLAELFGPA
jgi:MerR family transcriptional regulator, copper efflux regulator